jgi:hypothetical protein
MTDGELVEIEIHGSRILRHVSFLTKSFRDFSLFQLELSCKLLALESGPRHLRGCVGSQFIARSEEQPCSKPLSNSGAIYFGESEVLEFRWDIALAGVGWKISGAFPVGQPSITRQKIFDLNAVYSRLCSEGDGRFGFRVQGPPKTFQIEVSRPAGIVIGSRTDRITYRNFESADRLSGRALSA